MPDHQRKLDFVTDSLRPDLGGNLRHGDPATFSPLVWEYVVERLAIGSVLDVGSGEGHAARWFHRRGLVSYACEAQEDNVRRAVHPTVRLDLTESALTCPVDLVHCVEVVEHVDAQHLDHLLQTLANGRFVLMTHAGPGQPGHHHVNCQTGVYWVQQLAGYGYELLEAHTACIRKIASQEVIPTFFGQSGLLFARR